MNGFELAGKPLQVVLFDEASEESTENTTSNVLAPPGSFIYLIGWILYFNKSLGVELSETNKTLKEIPKIASPCFMLVDMFDPKTETDPDWNLDIQDDIIEECGKYGGN